MKKILYWLRSFKKLRTVNQANQMELSHYTNVFGDGINRLNCRSLWTDKYGNTYRCDELLENGDDLIFDEIKSQHPSLFK